MLTKNFCLYIGRFQHYDYKDKNLQKYNQLEPPDYNLKNVDTEIQVLYGTEDSVTYYTVLKTKLKTLQQIIINTFFKF